MFKKIANFLFSTRLTAVLFIVYATAMAVGTFLDVGQSTSPTPYSRNLIYNAWWFEAIMVVFMINFVGNIFRYRLLFLYTKFSSDKDKIIQGITNIIKYLKSLGYTLIIKIRPKSKKLVHKEHISDNVFICSDTYPNETLELLQICDLCVFFSSSAQTECLYSGVPAISFQTSYQHLFKELEYLKEFDKFFKFVNLNDWLNITFDNFVIKDLIINSATFVKLDNGSWKVIKLEFEKNNSLGI